MDTSIWGLVTIGGPILLGLVLIFVIVSNRKHRNPREIARTEQATRDLRERLNEEDKAGGS
ncbi:MAG: hypothetical protein AABZ73_05765 [Pseudomonadota bacterium]|uniref:hypothetical protein n=1 Tax=Sphingobium sp. TaxID=1912891 RepID=UPI002E201F98